MVDKRRIKTPEGTPQPDVPIFQLRRQFSSYDCLSGEEIKHLEKVVNDMVGFFDKSKIPHKVVDYVSQEIVDSNHPFEEFDIMEDKFDKKEKYFFKDPWEQRSMVIVREGERPI